MLNDLQGQHVRAFKMQLKPGFVDEYRKRHDEIWPDLAELLKSAGISQYWIFHDAQTNILFACMQCPTDFDSGSLAEHPVMQKWWQHMADIMDTHPDNEPVAVPLLQVFSLF